jgi:hypothetical protein
MRVHAFPDQGFGAEGGPADLAYQIAHHGHGCNCAGLGAGLRQRRDGRQRQKPKAKAPSANG